MNPEDLAALLAEARRIKQENPTASRKDIDLWIQENAPNVPSLAALTQMVEPTKAPAAKTPGLLARMAAAARQGPSDFVTAANANAGAGVNPAGAQFATGQQERLSQNFGRSMLRGATLNFDDNIARMIGAGDSGMYSPEGQASFDAYRQAHPGMDLVGNIAGGLPTGGLFGGAAKRALLAQAAKSAPETISAAQILTSQGTIPRALQGAGIGALYGGASAVGDDKSAQGVVGATLGGAAVGGALPLIVGGTQGAARVISSRRTAGRLARNGVEQMSVAGGTATGAPISGEPITLKDRALDFLNPARVTVRTESGLARMANDERDLLRMGRGASMTPMDADPTANGLLRTLGANSLRQNPNATTLQGVEALGARGAQTPAALQNDLTTAYRADGLRSPAPRGPSLLEGNRDVRAAQSIEGVLGGPRPVRGPDLAGSPQRARSGFTVADRVAEIDDQTRAFANSQEGYAGLRPVIQSGSGGVGTSPEVLDQSRLLVARGADNIVDEATRRFLQQTQDDLMRLQGGPGENAAVHIKDVGKTLKRMNDFIARARAPQPPPGTPGGIYVPESKLAEIEQARDAVLKYADDGFRGPQGQTFSDIQRRYAQGKADARGVQLGANLLDGSVAGEGNLSRARAAQLLRALPPAEMENARQGILARQIEKYRGADQSVNTGKDLTMLVNRSGGEYRQSELLQAAFPTQRQYQQVLTQQILLDAADQGAATLKTVSPAQLRAAYNRLAVPGQPAGVASQAQQQFQRSMLGALEEAVQNPKSARDFVNAAGEDIRSANGEWAQKFSIMFGPRGAQEMRQRLLLQARMQGNEEAISAAAQTTAATIRGGGEMIQGRGNAVSGEGILGGILRPLVQAASRTGTKTELAKLLTARGQSGMDAFRRAVREAATPVNLGPTSSRVLPAAVGYLFGSQPNDQ